MLDFSSFNNDTTHGGPLMLILTEQTILLNNEVLNVLHEPPFIHILVNDEKRILLFLPDRFPVRMTYNGSESSGNYFKPCGTSLPETIRKLSGHDDSALLLYGDRIPKFHALIFDLKLARPALLK